MNIIKTRKYGLYDPWVMIPVYKELEYIPCYQEWVYYLQDSGNRIVEPTDDERNKISDPVKQVTTSPSVIKQHPAPTGREGWVCPRCDRVNAPFVSTCPCYYKNKKNKKNKKSE